MKTSLKDNHVFIDSNEWVTDVLEFQDACNNNLYTIKKEVNMISSSSSSEIKEEKKQSQQDLKSQLLLIFVEQNLELTNVSKYVDKIIYLFNDNPELSNNRSESTTEVMKIVKKMYLKGQAKRKLVQSIMSVILHHNLMNSTIFEREEVENWVKNEAEDLITMLFNLAPNIFKISTLRKICKCLFC